MIHKNKNRTGGVLTPPPIVIRGKSCLVGNVVDGKTEETEHRASGVRKGERGGGGGGSHGMHSRSRGGHSERDGSWSFSGCRV